MSNTPKNWREEYLNKAKSMVNALPQIVSQLEWELTNFDLNKFFESFEKTEFFNTVIGNPIFKQMSEDILEAVETKNISKLYLNLNFLVNRGNQHHSDLKGIKLDETAEIDEDTYKYFFAQMMPALNSFRDKLYVLIDLTVASESKKILDLSNVNMIYANTVFDMLKWSMIKQYAAENMLSDEDKKMVNVHFDSANMSDKRMIIRLMLRWLMRAQITNSDLIIGRILETFFVINKKLWWYEEAWLLPDDEIKKYNTLLN